jgi:hypothetical protein
MKARLFLLGLRLAGPSSLAVSGAVVALASFFLWFLRPSSMGSEPGGPLEGSVVLILTLPWAGFVAGSLPFSREFKERNAFFLQVLPISRAATFWALMAGALVAGLGSLALALTLRPAFMAELFRSRGGDPLSAPAVHVLLLYLLVFAAGACYALLFTGATVYAIGAGLTAAFLMELARVLTVFVAGQDEDLLGRAFGAPSPRDWLTVETVSGLVLLTAVYALLARWFFVRGELTLLGARVRNGVLLLAAHAAFCTALLLGMEVRLRTLPWRIDPEGALSRSPDRGSLLVVERRQGHPRSARLNVVDLPTGRVTSRVLMDGLSSIHWSADSRHFVTSVADLSPVRRLGYLRSRSDEILLLSREGEELHRVRFARTRVRACPSATYGALFILDPEVTRGGAEAYLAPTRVVAIDEKGQPTELAGGPRVEEVDCREVDGGTVVAFKNPDHPLAWLVGPSVRPLPWPHAGRRDLRDWHVVGSSVLVGEAALQEVARRFSFASPARGAPVSYVAWDFVERPGWIYALSGPPGVENGELFGRNPESKSWLRLARGLSIRPIPLSTMFSAVAPSHCLLVPGTDGQACPNGLFVPGAFRAHQIRVHDGTQGTEVDVPGLVNDYDYLDLRCLPENGDLLMGMMSFKSMTSSESFPPDGSNASTLPDSVQALRVLLYRAKSGTIEDLHLSGVLIDNIEIADLSGKLAYYDSARKAVFLREGGKPERLLVPAP